MKNIVIIFQLQEWKSRRSRNEDVNQFIKGLLGEDDGTADELFHVARANLWSFFKRHIMRDSAFARKLYTLVAGGILTPGDFPGQAFSLNYKGES